VLLVYAARLIAAAELPVEPLPHVGQLYVLGEFPNGDDAKLEFFPHVGQYAEDELTDVRDADVDVFAFCVPQVAQTNESATRPL